MPENTFQLTAYLESLLPVALSFLAKLLFCLLLWFIGKKLIRLILKLIRRSGEQHQWEPTVARFLESLIKWGLYALLAYVMFEIMGGSSSSLSVSYTHLRAHET